MYRQILVSGEDSNCEQIVWSNDPNGEIKSVKLKTASYGLATASFLTT